MGKPTHSDASHIDAGVSRIDWLRTAVLGMCLLHGAAALGHGSVVDENDQCVIKIGFFRAHFKAYQPRDSGHREFCEDLPTAGETVFVLEYLHNSMREVPVDFRIVRDEKQVGRFARYSDVEALDLDQATVFYRAPAIEADGVLTVSHLFDVPGAYIGVVSAADPEASELHRAVFPFTVARIPWEYGYFAAAVGGLLLLGIWARRVFFSTSSGASS